MNHVTEPRPRHRADEPSKVTVVSIVVLAIVCLASGCGGSLRRPPPALIRQAEYVAVPYPPRPATVEIVPPRPENDRSKPPSEQFDESDLVWADGTWEWQTDRYRWEPGAWVVLPRRSADGEVRRTRWALVRRKEDGQLFFAPSRWRSGVGPLDPYGKEMDPPRPILRSATRQDD
ncbi:MAG: YXWGXW repeat-containing protein [Deltaproteobacteria bacterium]|nr:YXWGXW repeat-containing protein [Deltaproteobacteria bacterium]